MKKVLILILILILPIVALAADLFSDDFESGDLSAWDASGDAGADLTVAEGAALHGSYGANCLIDDTTNMYVQDNFDAATTYRARCYIDPNGLGMANNDKFTFLDASFVTIIDFKFTDALGYIITARTRDDSAVDHYITKNSITDEPHCIEVYSKSATGVGEDDGEFQLWVDGVSIGSESTLDSDTKTISYTRFGALGKDSGTSGTFFLDDFASNNDGSEIGEISDFALVKFNNVTCTKWNELFIFEWNAMSIP